MTDAREIIAQEFRRAHGNTCYPDASAGECTIAASAILSALTTAGFHILGPGEVDPVTEEMVEAAVQAIRPYTRKTLFIDEHRELIRAALKAAMEAKPHD